MGNKHSKFLNFCAFFNFVISSKSYRLNLIKAGIILEKKIKRGLGTKKIIKVSQIKKDDSRSKNSQVLVLQK